MHSLDRNSLKQSESGPGPMLVGKRSVDVWPVRFLLRCAADFAKTATSMVVSWNKAAGAGAPSFVGIDEHMQDQLILPMALATKRSRIVCSGEELTLHTRAAIWVAEKMTSAKFEIRLDNGAIEIVCDGCGFYCRDVRLLWRGAGSSGTIINQGGDDDRWIIDLQRDLASLSERGAGIAEFFATKGGTDPTECGYLRVRGYQSDPLSEWFERELRNILTFYALEPGE